MRASITQVTRRAFRVAVVVAIAAVAAGTGLMGTASAAEGKVHTVKMKGMTFVPAKLEVAVGDTVIWENVDVVPHTATAMKEGAPVFDSGNLQPKQTWRYVAEKSGTFPYVCLLHPMMTGTLTVR
jgi:plastocyanin